MLKLEYLKSILHYNPQIGEWRWLVNKNKKIKIGQVAGCISFTGKRPKDYRRIRIDGIEYASSRLAWFYMTGEWPIKEIDHHDRNKSNDCWNNLRSATEGQNQHNRSVSKNNKLGIKGVCKTKNGYQVQIGIDRKNYYIGCYKTVEEAQEAHQKATLKYHGEFACY